MGPSFGYADIASAIMSAFNRLPPACLNSLLHTFPQQEPAAKHGGRISPMDIKSTFSTPWIAAAEDASGPKRPAPRPPRRRTPKPAPDDPNISRAFKSLLAWLLLVVGVLMIIMFVRHS